MDLDKMIKEKILPEEHGRLKVALMQLALIINENSTNLEKKWDLESKVRCQKCNCVVLFGSVLVFVTVCVSCVLVFEFVLAFKHSCVSESGSSVLNSIFTVFSR